MAPDDFAPRSPLESWDTVRIFKLIHTLHAGLPKHAKGYLMPTQTINFHGRGFPTPPQAMKEHPELPERAAVRADLHCSGGLTIHVPPEGFDCEVEVGDGCPAFEVIAQDMETPDAAVAALLLAMEKQNLPHELRVKILAVRSILAGTFPTYGAYNPS